MSLGDSLITTRSISSDDEWKSVHNCVRAGYWHFKKSSRIKFMAILYTITPLLPLIGGEESICFGNIILHEGTGHRTLVMSKFSFEISCNATV